MNETREKLEHVYGEWLADNRLPEWSADEFQQATLTREQWEWLQTFKSRWEELEQAERLQADLTRWCDRQAYNPFHYDYRNDDTIAWLFRWPFGQCSYTRAGLWYDSTYKNDACPSAELVDDVRHVTFRLWLDYPNPDDREDPDAPRFALMVDTHDSHGDVDSCRLTLSSENLQRLVDLVTTQRNVLADPLQKTFKSGSTL